MTDLSAALSQLPPETRDGITLFVKSVSEALGTDLVSVILYGSAARSDFCSGESDVNLLLVLRTIDVAQMQKLMPVFDKSLRLGISPMLLTPDELKCSADAFAGKFFSMREERKVLYGIDILENVSIPAEALRLRCEQEIRNMLLRLRRGYLSQRGRDLPRLLWSMGRHTRDIVRVALALTQDGILPRERALEAASVRFGFDARPVQEVEGLRSNDCLTPEAAEALFSRFLSAIAIITDAIDRLVIR
ncbi:MAG: hypothetical protein HQM09_09030 [Candidatus Riflebacteria bacterium]|nr:hypothetical protein [Candidatus Riflebacteria bacterium]